MDTFLDILREQVKNLKENYYNFMGSFTNMFEFSNYTIMDESNRIPIYTKQYKEINAKLKKLYQHLLELREEISNL